MSGFLQAAYADYESLNLAEGLPWRLTYIGLECWLVHCDVVRVHVMPRHVQELVLVLPANRILFELFSFGRRGRRIGDLGN
jgi:hypothetical protein